MGIRHLCKYVSQVTLIGALVRDGDSDTHRPIYRSVVTPNMFCSDVNKPVVKVVL